MENWKDSPMNMSMSNMPLSPMMDHRDQHQQHNAMGNNQLYRSTTVLRRGQPFFMAVRMRDRNFDARRDILRVSFNFGPSPQVTKGTRVVLPFRMTQREFTRAPQKWDIRLHQQDGMNITFQVRNPLSFI